MAEPVSKILEARKLMESRMRMPSYQRDFKWDSEKMSQLWIDLFAHLFKYNMKKSVGSSDLSRYFVGSIVIDHLEDQNMVVDGQQRFTTLTVISAAVRDALIATGFIGQARELDDHMITSHHHINDPIMRNRFELLDIPPGDKLSSEFGLSGYRKRIVPIPLNLKTVETEKGSTSIRVEGLTSQSKIPWSVADDDGWEFSLLRKDGTLDIERYHFIVPPDDENGLRHNDNPPSEIILESELIEDIPPGLKIVLLPDLRWPENGLEFPTSGPGRAKLNDPSYCDLFHSERREFYFEVRKQTEHFILGHKEYFTSSQIIKNTGKVISIGLHLDDPEHRSLIDWFGRLPAQGEKIEFHKMIPMAPKDIPSEDELVDIIKDLSETGGAESQTIELKATVRTNLKECWKHKTSGEKIAMIDWKKLKKSGKDEYTRIYKDKNSEHACIKTISALLNTHGGALIAGVTDYGDIMGIEVDNFTKNGETKFSADVAEMHITQIVERDIGNVAAALVKPKVVLVGGKSVLYVHVPKWNSPEDPPYCKTPDGKEKFYVRFASSITKSLTDNQREKHLISFFRGSLGPDAELQSVKRTFTVTSIQENHGRPRISGNLEGDENLLKRCNCRIDYLVNNEEWPDHLADPKKRAEQIIRVIYRVIFSRILFQNDPAAAIDHFMITNDASKMETLTAYDLASAFTQKVIRPAIGKEKNQHQEKIERLWNDLSLRIYLSTGKKDADVQLFFYYYLMASMKKKTPSKRWSKKESWIGLKKEIDRHIMNDGSFDYKGLVNLYEEMKHYSIIFTMAFKPDCNHWDEEHYTKAELRDERTYLKILAKAGVRQHIPVYMALAYASETKDKKNRAEIIKGFMKNWVYVWLRYKTVPALDIKMTPGFKDNVIHRNVESPTGWVNNIHEWIGNSEGGETSKDHIEEICGMPLELESADKDKYPWAQDIELWEELNVGSEQSKNANDIGILLYSYERAVEGKTNPTMSRLFSPSRPQLEHVLPEDSKLWGHTWYRNGNATPSHATWVYSLGNQIILEDSKNSHVRNQPFKVKVPINGCDPCPSGKEHNHYEGTDYKSAKRVVSYFNDKKIWTQGAMKEHSKKIMNILVEYFSPN